MHDVRSKNPDLKLLLAVGGWNHGTKPFTRIVANQSNMDAFATNSIKFLRQNGFDGLDLDWEYPANRGSPPEDKERFTSLVKTLRTKYDNEDLRNGNSRLLLTAAVAASKPEIESAYEISKIAENLDFINLMAFDMNSDFYNGTQCNTPLYKSQTPYEANNVTKYIMDNGLGGGMMWALDLDDFHGVCGQGKNPLMKTMKDVFSGKPGLDFVPTALPVVG
ncbi:E3.2.1.14 [Mytilus edulis]|uniref:E3.2.1.14 n=1 Tax=Mytilus edulis TaxID=6550 RepID=A0A8S3UXW6_MYTED|nr:E3.2.1.14 [Mytilus edulis]